MPSGGIPSWPFAPSGGVPSGFSGGVSAEASVDAVSASGSSAAASAAVLPQAVSESRIAAASRIEISFFMENSLLVLVLWLYSIAGI